MPLTENQLRRRAAKLGYALRKDRCRTPRCVDHQGGWMVIEPNRNFIVAGEHFDLTDEDVERMLAD